MKKIIILILLLNSGLYLSKGTKEKTKSNLSNNAQQVNLVYSKFNINNISTYMRNDGLNDHTPNSHSGLEFPSESNIGAVFVSGFIWGGKVNGEIRVGGSTYRSGLLPGSILGEDSNYYREDETLESVRIFRVRPDYKRSALRNELIDEEKSYQEIYDQYEKDWNEWPVEKGAPFEDLDNDGIYNPEIDIPGIPGAHQTLWYVANDFDTTQSRYLYGSDPIGLEIQVTSWGYNTDGPLMNTTFRKYRVKNFSGMKIEDMYFGYWNDVDLGGAGDDFVGCDTSFSLTYTYNGEISDSQYGDSPPALGFQILQGPIVEGEQSDTAHFNFAEIIGKRNLGITAHAFYIGGDPVYSDPSLGNYSEGTIFMYNNLQGLIASTGQQFKDPTKGNDTKFTLNGDPLTRTGWIDGIAHSPGDRRTLISSGPFEMEADSTQEFIIAVSAAQGPDNLNSVKRLKLANKYLKKDIFEPDPASFIKISVPSPPEYQITQLDNKIRLEISRDSEVENFSENGFSFQGYNIYQYKYESQFMGNEDDFESLKILTLDLADTIGNIYGSRYNWETGRFEDSILLQEGRNTGIPSEISISLDHIDSTYFINGKEYFYGISAYTFNPNHKRKSFESNTSVGSIFYKDSSQHYSYGDTVSIVHLHGKSDKAPIIIMTDPQQITKTDYRIEFFKSKGVYFPRIINDVTNQVVIDSFANEVEFDGLFIKIPNLYGIRDLFEVDQNDDVIDPRIGELHFSLGSTGYLLTNRAGAINQPPYARDHDRFNLWGSDDVTINFGEESLTWDYASETVHKDASDSETYAPFSIYRYDYFADTTYRLFAGFWDTDENGNYSMDTISNGDGSSRWTDPHGWGVPSYEPIYAWQGYNTEGNEISYNTENEDLYKIDNSLLTSAGTSWGDGYGEFKYPFITATLMVMYADNASLPIGNKIKFITYKNNTDEDVYRFNPQIVVNVEEQKPLTYQLKHNYPNPFNPTTTIEYSIKENSFVKLRVYNILGQQVAELVNKKQTKGSHRVKFNANNLASGVYIYRLEAEEFVDVKKMILLR